MALRHSSVWNPLAAAALLCLLTGCQSYKIEHGSWALIRYNEGMGRMVTPIMDADQASFRPINRQYARDKFHVYFENRIIPTADPATFTCLGRLYSLDQHRAFWRDREIVGANPDGFRVVDGPGLLSRDNKDFYFAHTPLGVVDPPSFQIINRGWKKDSRAYYATPYFSKAGKVDCDYSTMKILNDYYAVDARRAYYDGQPIEGVDVKTFHVIGTMEARDRFRKYLGNKEDWRK